MSEWRSLAACRDMPTALFYTDRGESVDEAKAVCASCDVCAECLADACTPGQVERIGVWGGMSERERRTYRARLRRQQGAAAGAVEARWRQTCGSEAGYMAHRRHNEKPCQGCTEGASKAASRRTADRRTG